MILGSIRLVGWSSLSAPSTAPQQQPPCAQVLAGPVTDGAVSEICAGTTPRVWQPPRRKTAVRTRSAGSGGSSLPEGGDRCINAKDEAPGAHCADWCLRRTASRRPKTDGDCAARDNFAHAGGPCASLPLGEGAGRRRAYRCRRSHVVRCATQTTGCR